MSSTFEIEKTDVLCPNCLKNRLIKTDVKKAFCDRCGQNYTIMDARISRNENNIIDVLRVCFDD